MYRNMTINHAAIASKAQLKAFSHSVGLTFSSCIRINGAGSAPSFSWLVSSLADSAVKFPSICAEPSQILLWITGLVIISHPINIAISFQILFDVILQNISFHVSSKLITTTGCHNWEVLTEAYLKFAPFNIFQSSDCAFTHVSLSWTNTSSIV